MNDSPTLKAAIAHYNEILSIDEFAHFIIGFGQDIQWVRTNAPAPEGHELYPDSETIIQAALIYGGHRDELPHIAFPRKAFDLFDSAATTYAATPKKTFSR